MFSKILVANRGEIALRIIRACRELGVRTVAVYSEADAQSLPVAAADEKICIGPPPSARSYLNSNRIVAAAKESGADAVHPGYGYLAENEAFARSCAAEGLVFIGPSPDNLRLAGEKIEAKRIMKEAGIPVIPGSDREVGTIAEALRIGAEVGYPVLLKASGGGGGRGIRICPDPAALREDFPVARGEARVAFGAEALYIEKYLAAPRHIEFQILGDQRGKIVHLGERECSIQRRYQKLIEESPSPRLTPELRGVLGALAVRAAEVVGYRNAGTVEFLLDGNERFYFMEINARIQVEHPVTEMTTGIDLVREQIKLAAGSNLTFSQADIQPRGWAIECRINAEDPEKNFLPSPGVIRIFRPPGGFGVRLDTHLFQGYELPIYYDSLIAKLIAHDRTRAGAVRIMRRALEEFRIEPIKTTLPLHRRILDDPDFQAGAYDTHFIQRWFPEEEDDDVPRAREAEKKPADPQSAREARELYGQWREDPQALKSYLKEHPDLEAWSDGGRLALAQASESYQDDPAASEAIRGTVVRSVNRAEKLEDLPTDRAYQFLLDRHVNAPGKPPDASDPLARAKGKLQGFSDQMVDGLFDQSMADRKGDDGIQDGVGDFQDQIARAVQKNPALARQMEGSLDALSKNPEIAERLEDIGRADDNWLQDAYHGATDFIGGAGKFLGDAVRWTAKNTLGRAIDAGVGIDPITMAYAGISRTASAIDPELGESIREE
ncbi:MAG: acetyl-CoA carboxylase biotin carboxylase subunit, partial [Deltaproteobacteria bacterium]|nr:acetyl-CoA carboxylase biotin carboxylase subunit [Deltaproteobacteria bacterium]